MRSAVFFWPDTRLNCAIDVENVSVWKPLEEKRPVRNPIPIILVIIIARLAWIISFFVRIVVSTKQEEVAFPS